MNGFQTASLLAEIRTPGAMGLTLLSAAMVLFLIALPGLLINSGDGRRLTVGRCLVLSLAVHLLFLGLTVKVPVVEQQQVTAVRTDNKPIRIRLLSPVNRATTDKDQSVQSGGSDDNHLDGKLDFVLAPDPLSPARTVDMLDARPSVMSRILADNASLHQRYGSLPRLPLRFDASVLPQDELVSIDALTLSAETRQEPRHLSAFRANDSPTKLLSFRESEGVASIESRQDGSLAHLSGASLVGRRIYNQSPDPLASRLRRSPVNLLNNVSLHSSEGELENYRNTVPAWLRLRLFADRNVRAKLSGNSRETEHAVTDALDAFAGSQLPEGDWPVGSRDDRVSTAGQVMLAYLAAGHTHRFGGYQQTMRRAVDFLVAAQLSDGMIRDQASQQEIADSELLGHAVATLAFCELYFMTDDPTLEQPFVNALDCCMRQLQQEFGGIRFVTDRKNPLDRLAWYLLAMKTAEQCGHPVPDRYWEMARLQLIDSPISSTESVESVSRRSVSQWLFCRLILGDWPERPELRQAIDLIESDEPVVTNSDGSPDLAMLHFATLSLHQIRSTRSSHDDWIRAVHERLIAAQDRFAGQSGRWDVEAIPATALTVLCLEVGYRYASPPSDRTASR